MATESVATRIQTISASLEGIETIAGNLVDGTQDLRVQRIACAISDHLQRLGKDLDSIAHEMELLDRKEA